MFSQRLLLLPLAAMLLAVLPSRVPGAPQIVQQPGANKLAPATSWKEALDRFQSRLVREFLSGRVDNRLLPAIAVYAFRSGTLSRQDELVAVWQLKYSDAAMLAVCRAGRNGDVVLTEIASQALGSQIVSSLFSSVPPASRSPTSEETARIRFLMLMLKDMPLEWGKNLTKVWHDFDNGYRVLNDLIIGERIPKDLRTLAAEVLVRFDRSNTDSIRTLYGKVDVPRSVTLALLPVLATSESPDVRYEALEVVKDIPYRESLAFATAMAGVPGGADAVVESVKKGKIPARVLQEPAVLSRLRAARLPDLDKRIAALTEGLKPLDPKIADLIARRTDAFPKAKVETIAGAKVYARHCAACHKLDGVGRAIAPPLDGIGIRGAERLLEDILDPNRNVHQAYRTRVIVTKDGRTITGLMLTVADGKLVVADGKGKELRLPLADIESNRGTMLSLMPSDFATTIPEADCYNLIAYLREQQPKASK